MNPIFCFIGGIIRYLLLSIQCIVTGKERPKYMMVCQNKSNSWLGFKVLLLALVIYLLVEFL